jgi:hypothetical protein
VPAAGAGLGVGAGSGATGATVAGAGCGVGAAFGATLRAGGRFLGFAVLAAVRLGARLATAFFFALVARFFERVDDFSTRFFVFALLFDFALLLGLADRFVFAFLAMRVAPLLRSLNRTDSSGHAAKLRDPLQQARRDTFPTAALPVRAAAKSASGGRRYCAMKKYKPARHLHWKRK